jgi:hypothetical protein
MYIYDLSLTLSAEIRLYGRRLMWPFAFAFIPVRYASLLYQVVVIVGITWSPVTTTVRVVFLAAPRVA